jgi:hypothetical protein
VPDARQIGDSLVERGVKLSLGGTLYDPADPMGKMFLQHPGHLRRVRGRPAQAPDPGGHGGRPRAKGKLKGKPPKLSARQQAELVRMHGTGEYTIAGLMEVFSVGRATVYRTLERVKPAGSKETG